MFMRNNPSDTRTTTSIRPRSTLRPPALIAAVAATLPAALAPAAVFQWDGGGANTSLTTAANWNPNTAPVSNAQNDLEFGTIALAPPNNTAVNNTGSDFNVNFITFN